MIKKTKENKVDFTTHLNEDELRKMGASKREIIETSKVYEDANKHLKRYYRKPGLLCMNCKLLPDLILLKGNAGQIAYVRRDFDYQTNQDKCKLIIEFPLDMLAGEQRNWVKCVSKFFKPLLIKESESASSERDFQTTQKLYKKDRVPNFTKKPYTEFKGIETETNNSFIIRSRSYADSAPHGAERGDRIRKRDRMMKKIFLDYRQKDGFKERDCIRQVKKWLQEQQIWHGRKGHKSLSDSTIVRICGT